MGWRWCVDHWVLINKKNISLKLMSYISLMDCKTIENEMFELIREHSKHVEMWWPVKGFDNYQVSTKGRIRNVITARILKIFINGRGYYHVTLFKNGTMKTLRVHRLIAMAFIPTEDNREYVDHIDHNSLNNNLINLRWASNSENLMNQGKKSNNTSGITGVHFVETSGKWIAQICLNRKKVYLGCFHTMEKAKEARIKAVKEIYKEFANADELK